MRRVRSAGFWAWAFRCAAARSACARRTKFIRVQNGTRVISHMLWWQLVASMPLRGSGSGRRYRSQRKVFPGSVQTTAINTVRGRRRASSPLVSGSASHRRLSSSTAVPRWQSCDGGPTMASRCPDRVLPVDARLFSLGATSGTCTLESAIRRRQAPRRLVRVSKYSANLQTPIPRARSGRVYIPLLPCVIARTC